MTVVNTDVTLIYSAYRGLRYCRIYWRGCGKILERATGIEPATSSLGSWHSTAELRPLSGRQGIFLYWIILVLSMNSPGLHRPPAEEPSALSTASDGAKNVAPETARV